MKKILIFTLLLFACRETTINPRCEFVTISDALPVQFWLVNCQTYNEVEVCGVHKKCYCQPWGCDDQMNIQFTDDSEEAEYYLGIYDEDGNVLSYQDFSKDSTFVTNSISLQFSNTGQLFLNGNGWDSFPGTNRASAEPFFYNGTFQELHANATGTGTGSGQENTRYLATARPDSDLGWPPGDYVVRIRAANGSDGDADAVGIAAYGMTSSSQQVTISTSSSQNLPRDASFYNVDVSFTLDQNYEYIAFAFTRLGGGGTFDIFVAIQGISIISAPTTEEVLVRNVYNYGFTPSDLGICDEKIQLKILSDTSPETIVAKSDCIDVRTNHNCSNLINYSNTRNFAGLIYQDQSPDVDFYIRIPSIFFHEQPDETDETIELVNSVLSLNSELKEKRLFETDYLPYYMHRKIQLILKHQSVTISGKEWVKRDAYEIVEGDRRWPVKKAKVFLMDKNYVHRNIL